ncbi:hypothetical protein GTO10_01470 [Candidatus Saccharibacteria bacterium]|nr:hypothetical protein [Candidatus Saccharibacteria bacterium]
MMRMAGLMTHAGALADTNGTWGMMGWPMMSSTAGSGVYAWFWYLQWFVVWALIIGLLIAAIRYLWKKGGK